MDKEIKEFHLFAGIGGGIYGGKLLGHRCCGGVEIDSFCQRILRQRQEDGWMDKFDIYGDLTKLKGNGFKGQFDVLCGGFPCQAFSHAAHGDNIAEKNLWPEMRRFVIESKAPVVFGENVTLKAIDTAKDDLEKLGYRVQRCRLSCEEIGADHRRNRFWLLAVKDEKVFKRIKESIDGLPVFSNKSWSYSLDNVGDSVPDTDRRAQLKAIGNAQSPIVAACAFRVLVNRLAEKSTQGEIVSREELDRVINQKKTWIQQSFGEEFGLVHTPTTMANYACKSMMKHQGCRNFVTVFKRPQPRNAEYLMGFPIGASSASPIQNDNFRKWQKDESGK